MVYETLNIRSGTLAIKWLTSVDLPDPEGAEMIKTVVMPPAPRRYCKDRHSFCESLFEIEALLPDLVDLALGA